MNIYKWGIIGLGKIANKFAASLEAIPTAHLIAIASRDKEKLKSFSLRYHVKKIYRDYDDLIDDTSVEIIYIAIPHSFHVPLAVQCILAGKHILVEKPFALNAMEAKKVFDLAIQKNVFVMEALWTRFIPSTQKVLDILQNGDIGVPISMHADFGIKAEFNKNSRLYNKELGGGSLLDIGIYPVFLSYIFFGTPLNILASGRLAETDVDEQCNVMFEHINKEVSQLSCSFLAYSSQEAIINGTDGQIRLNRPFFGQTTVDILSEWKLKGHIKFEYISNGLNYQVSEVHKCIDERRIQSSEWSFADTLSLMSILDRIRKIIGVKYNVDVVE
ncbi:MAG: Gfo/Idh/MocA family oxidoreductase [Chitinophagaceae bacterium]|nr:Gfo/Idh/MocA family oxidoreductase [Chitinophagaceae bacterium]